MNRLERACDPVGDATVYLSGLRIPVTISDIGIALNFNNTNNKYRAASVGPASLIKAIHVFVDNQY